MGVRVFSWDVLLMMMYNQRGDDCNNYYWPGMSAWFPSSMLPFELEVSRMSSRGFLGALAALDQRWYPSFSLNSCAALSAIRIWNHPKRVHRAETNAMNETLQSLVVSQGPNNSFLTFKNLPLTTCKLNDRKFNSARKHYAYMYR